jgi:hypothetical protein
MGPNVHGFVMVELEYGFEHGFVAQREAVPVDDVSVFSPAQWDVVVMQVFFLRLLECFIEIVETEMLKAGGPVVCGGLRGLLLDQVIDLGEFLVKVLDGGDDFAR